MNTTFSFVPLAGYMGGWTCYAFVFARHANVVQCYMNGTNIGSMILNDNGESLGTSPVEMEGVASGSPLLLNEVSVWNRALGAGEIVSLYGAGTSGTGVVALSAGSMRNPAPAEPFSIVNYTLKDLTLLSNVLYWEGNAPLPTPILAKAASSPTNLQLQVYGIPGWNYILQGSTNLVSWHGALSNATESIPTSVGSTSKGIHFFRAASP
jgi:hypothetical protein